MAKRRAVKVEQTYKVLRDQQEKAGYLDFPAGNRCLGTETVHLKTGDYTLAGHEDRFLVERKGSPAEFAANLFQPRFERELCRLDLIEHPYLVLEFSFADLVNYPVNSGVPQHLWPKLRLTPQGFVKAFHEMVLKHPRLRVAFVGDQGRPFCSSLFKRIVDNGAR